MKRKPDDLFDSFEAFAKDPEKYYNDLIFENFSDVLDDDNFRESILRHHVKKKKE